MEAESCLRRSVKINADSGALRSLADALVQQNRILDAEQAIRSVRIFMRKRMLMLSLPSLELSRSTPTFYTTMFTTKKQ